ncbi:hypothetical protein P153DRAFT_369682, partial [Dothidotthia symphoricarpi CBS 119687]
MPAMDLVCGVVAAWAFKQSKCFGENAQCVSVGPAGENAMPWSSAGENAIESC